LVVHAARRARGQRCRARTDGGLAARARGTGFVTGAAVRFVGGRIDTSGATRDRRCAERGAAACAVHALLRRAAGNAAPAAILGVALGVDTGARAGSESRLALARARACCAARSGAARNAVTVRPASATSASRRRCR
jgi:hypothetical protein